MSGILITGANGAIGSQIQEIKHYQIHRTTIEQVDLTDKLQVKDLIARTNPEVIIHLAALLGDTCEADPELAERVNVEASVNLMKMAQSHGLKRFIFTSSSAVYDQRAYKPTTESENIDPKSVYGQTKLKAEQELTKQNHGILIMLRLFNVYGKGFSKSLINRLLTNEHIKIVNPDHYMRDYIHYTDVIEVIKRAVDQELEVGEYTVNVGSGVIRNTSSIIHYLQTSGICPNYEVEHKAGASVSWANIIRLNKLFNYKPKTDIILR